ncbi:hypothetical protein JCM3765_002084 [Sporobolomyces pararoseus]
MTSPLVLGPILPGDWPTSANDPSYTGYRDAITQSTSTLLESIKQAETGSSNVFQKGKLFNSSDCPTQAFTSSSSTVPGAGNTDGYKWHVRVSTHKDVSYEQFKMGLLENHSVNERDYIEDCKTADKIQVIKEGEMEVWRMLYHQPFPASNRSFSFVIFTSELASTSERSFIVVSIPVAHPGAPPEKGYVRGRYVSVENCRETPQGVVWTMAVSSDAGGMVPKFVSEKAMPSKISEDVPSFLKWIKTKPAPASTTNVGSSTEAPTLPQIDRSEAL